MFKIKEDEDFLISNNNEITKCNKIRIKSILKEEEE